MYRLYLTFLFVFLFISFVANSQISNYNVLLKRVTVDTATQEVKISWGFDRQMDSVSFIKKCFNNCYTENGYNETVFETYDLSWTDTAKNAAERQNFYCITCNECNGKSSALSNMFLEAKLSEHCKNSILLSWTPYIEVTLHPATKINYITDYYKIWYRKNGNNSFEIFDTIKTFDSTDPIEYEVIHLDTATFYEFLIQAIINDDTLFSFSNIAQCKTETEKLDSVRVTINRVSVIDDIKIEIDVITDDFPDTQNFKEILLMRSFEPTGSNNRIIIDSLPYSSNNNYFFTDNNVDPHSGLYYYQAIATHHCKANDISNVLTNIFLTGRRVENEKYKDRILFVQIGVEPSESYDLLINGNLFPTQSPLTAENNEYLVDVESFMKKKSEVVYQIQSQKGWYSNTIIIPHEPIVTFPTAFYPQGLPPDKTFYPIIYFPSEDNYLFIIYNRWGQELYRSIMPPVFEDYDNMQGRWDGTFQGKECPAGIYAYKISYSYNNGKEKYSNSGSFMLVR